MNLYLKNISLLFCIILVIAMSDCTKDKAKGPDVRDLIVGTYNCVEHYYNWSIFPNPPMGTSSDSIIGPSIISISKLPTDDSSIVVNGNTFTFYSANGTQIRYTSPGSNSTNYANFTIGNDSIWFQDIVDFGVYKNRQYYYAGHKQ